VPVRSLPRDPNIEQLRNLAKTVQHLVREGEPGAIDLVREFHPRFANLAAGAPKATRFTRADMQLTLARSYGFPSRTTMPARAVLDGLGRCRRIPTARWTRDGVVGASTAGTAGGPNYLARLSLMGITIAMVVIARWRTRPIHPVRSWCRIAEYA
jgi:hypothetical protein